MAEDMLEVTVTDYIPFAQDDSVIVFRGITNNDASDNIRFAVDHGPARALIDALERGEGPSVWLEQWQILFSENNLAEQRSKGRLVKALADARASTSTALQACAFARVEHESAMRSAPQPENMFEIASTRRGADTKLEQAIMHEMEAVLRARDGGVL